MRHLNAFRFPLLVILLAGLLLAACGKKGPLYLPDRPRSTPDQTQPQN